ncbi:DUF4129 domain-containing protein [Oerskovia flava]|uniref:DUF4129 domain-containing protein n=1 Tax=Oerskovia flava TaxID=2986422 RepID=UPI00223F3E3D|nr:DUF4129 domain-containing protein [Oerskovia sp. JB1-3-2]
MSRPGTPRTTIAAVAALVVLLVLAAATGTTPDWTSPTDTTTTAPAPEPDPVTTAPVEDLEADQPRIDEQTGDVLQIVLTLLTVLAATILLAVLRRFVRRGPGRADPAPPTAPGTGETLEAHDTDVDALPELRDATTRAQQQLTAPTLAPHDAIIAAWVTLEDAAATAGTTRDPAQTPTEFTVAVLDRTPAPPHAVTTLRDLYHRARFTSAAVAAHDVTTAHTALTDIAHALGTLDAPTGTDPTPPSHHA